MDIQTALSCALASSRYSVGDDIVTTSVELRGKPKSFWAKAFGATCISWGSRFLVINFDCAAFFNVSDHLLLYARQLIMWVILLISPTPGSSGVAEVAFSGFFRDLLPAVGYIGALAVIWRILSYYLYLFIGTIVLPRWLRNTAGSRRGSTLRTSRNRLCSKGIGTCVLFRRALGRDLAVQ